MMFGGFIIWSLKLILVITSAHNVLCATPKLERKQDYFDVENFDNKREYGLNEIGKRGFTSTLGYDYTTSTEYGGSGVVSSTYSSIRPGGGSGALLSPARDLIPPPVRSAVYSSSTSPPTTRSDYMKFGGISSSPTNSKEFHSHHRSPISRRSPPHHHHHHHHPGSISHYFDEEINTAAATNRGGSLNHGSYGLVADNEGKLIGYRGSIIPGYTESQSVITSGSSGGPDQSNFIGGYFPGSEYPKPKLGLASSASSSYTSTPVYYPGREEDHSYRMRDTTSQGYSEEEELNPSSEDNDFTIGSNPYQPSPLSPPPPPRHHYHASDHNDRHPGHSHSHREASRFSPFGRDHPPPGISYSPYSQNPRISSYDFNRRTTPSSYDIHGSNTMDRSPPYAYSGIGYNDYGSS